MMALTTWTDWLRRIAMKVWRWRQTPARFNGVRMVLHVAEPLFPTPPEVSPVVRDELQRRAEALHSGAFVVPLLPLVRRGVTIQARLDVPTTGHTVARVMLASRETPPTTARL